MGKKADCFSSFFRLVGVGMEHEGGMIGTVLVYDDGSEMAEWTAGRAGWRVGGMVKEDDSQKRKERRDGSCVTEKSPADSRLTYWGTKSPPMATPAVLVTCREVTVHFCYDILFPNFNASNLGSIN